MESFKGERVLVSCASIAGLSTAYWMNKIGYKVTVVEIANGIRMGGTAVDLRGNTLDNIRHMGMFEQIKSSRLTLEMVECKNANDGTEGSMLLDVQRSDDEIELERDKLVTILFDGIKDGVDFIFNSNIIALSETKDDIRVTFRNGTQHTFNLVIGCDGTHSKVRNIWFGNERECTHFLEGYFSITIADKLLIKQNTMQLYNVPVKAVMLNAYNNKTDIVFSFFSEKEIPYNYRDDEQQRKIIRQQFAGESWRTAELLEEINNPSTFYFDKFCQIKMPSWTKGRVALVGDAAYCASPAAGMGGSLAIDGATALADALQKHNGNFELAFSGYDKNLRPFIEEVQTTAESYARESFIPRTEEAIRKRNTQAEPF